MERKIMDPPPPAPTCFKFLDELLKMMDISIFYFKIDIDELLVKSGDKKIIAMSSAPLDVGLVVSGY